MLTALPAGAQESDGAAIEAMTAIELARLLAPEGAEIAYAEKIPADTGYQLSYSGPVTSAGYSGVCMAEVTEIQIGPPVNDDADDRWIVHSRRTGHRFYARDDAAGIPVLDPADIDETCADTPPPLESAPGFFDVDDLEFDVLAPRRAMEVFRALIRARRQFTRPQFLAASWERPEVWTACEDRTDTPDPDYCTDPVARATEAPLSTIWGVGIDPCREAPGYPCLIAAYAIAGTGDRMWVEYTFDGLDPLRSDTKVSRISVTGSTLER